MTASPNAHFAIWGATTGGSLGLLESAVALQQWKWFGAPNDFVVRPHQVALFIVMNTMCGVVVGVGFGLILGNMCRRRHSDIEFLLLYLVMLTLGVFVYFVQYRTALEFRLPLWFLGDVLLFCTGMLTAPAFMTIGSTTSESS